MRGVFAEKIIKNGLSKPLIRQSEHYIAQNQN
jgi:hypothetical protein